MKKASITPAFLLTLAMSAHFSSGQVLDSVPDALILPKGNTFGIQVTCTACDTLDATDTIRASVDDTNYVTVDKEDAVVVGDPFETVFNVKGENQGGTILRLALADGVGNVIVQVSVTIQVTEGIDDDCIFDDLTLVEPRRTGMLTVLRQYRDQVLAASVSGRRYSELYYRHSQEVSEILDADPRLRNDVLNLLEVHLPDLNAALDGTSITLTRKEAGRIDDVLARIGSRAGPKLRRVTFELRFDLRGGKKLRQVGVEVQSRR